MADARAGAWPSASQRLRWTRSPDGLKRVCLERTLTSLPAPSLAPHVIRPGSHSHHRVYGGRDGSLIRLVLPLARDGCCTNWALFGSRGYPHLATSMSISLWGLRSSSPYVNRPSTTHGSRCARSDSTTNV